MGDLVGSLPESVQVKTTHTKNGDTTNGCKPSRSRTHNSPSVPASRTAPSRPPVRFSSTASPSLRRFACTAMSFPTLDYRIRRLDHTVKNMAELGKAVSYLKGLSGFHEFVEFTMEDVRTSESGLNSVVLVNNLETMLLPLNELVYGRKRKSQIETYLEHNEGASVQHLALVSEDIFRTLREMRMQSSVGGFEFMPSPPPTYYANLHKRAADVLTID
ncbi:hypothetical protein Fmac_014757 [Flemingia macrophylla]|uniref:4-hydroxyphenylpyruvate dioxygenase n=1 Tax=Flemingia macrophylla TaxID=520843 RepID=A0ABD1MCQ7_9FABA